MPYRDAIPSHSSTIQIDSVPTRVPLDKFQATDSMASAYASHAGGGSYPSITRTVTSTGQKRKRDEATETAEKFGLKVPQTERPQSRQLMPPPSSTKVHAMTPRGHGKSGRQRNPSRQVEPVSLPSMEMPIEQVAPTHGMGSPKFRDFGSLEFQAEQLENSNRTPTLELLDKWKSRPHVCEFQSINHSPTQYQRPYSRDEANSSLGLREGYHSLNAQHGHQFKLNSLDSGRDGRRVYSNDPATRPFTNRPANRSQYETPKLAQRISLEATHSSLASKQWPISEFAQVRRPPLQRPLSSDRRGTSYWSKLPPTPRKDIRSGTSQFSTNPFPISRPTSHYQNNSTPFAIQNGHSVPDLDRRQASYSRSLFHHSVDRQPGFSSNNSILFNSNNLETIGHVPSQNEQGRAEPLNLPFNRPQIVTRNEQNLFQRQHHYNHQPSHYRAEDQMPVRPQTFRRPTPLPSSTPSLVAAGSQAERSAHQFLQNGAGVGFFEKNIHSKQTPNAIYGRLNRDSGGAITRSGYFSSR
jgi:hypothetical protein